MARRDGCPSRFILRRESLGRAALSFLLCMGAVVPTASAAAEVALLDSRISVIKALGPATTVWSPPLCPDSTIAIYRSPQAILKLVFDANDRLHAIGLIAMSRPRNRDWPELRWPNVSSVSGASISYAAHGGLAPWFFNVSAKEFTYFERATKLSANGGRLYLGSVSISNSTAFAMGSTFPFEEAQASTERDVRGTVMSDASSLKKLRAWRRRTKPNSLVTVAAEALTTEERCGGFFLGRVSHPDMAVR